MFIHVSLKRCFCTVVVLVIGIVDSGAKDTQDSVYRSDSDSAALQVLEMMPPWSVANATNAEIIPSLLILAKFDSRSLRSAIKHFENMKRSRNNYDIAVMGKLFVLNRYLFEVPEKEKLTGSFFGGFDGIPQDEQYINILWPFSVDSDGRLRLTGKYNGYTGPPFRALQEFDYFEKVYGRRKFSQRK